MSVEVVGLGALNMDYLYQVERILEDGETIVKESTVSPGGSAANTIYGLAKLGADTGFIGVVGDDINGKILQQDFDKVGVDTSQIKVKTDAKTGSALCLSDKLGQRSLYVSPGANNLLTIGDLSLTYLNKAKMLHISSFANDKQSKVLLRVMNKLSSAVKVSFSPGTLYASQGLKVLSPILDKTYVLFINQNELRQLTHKNIANGAETCLKQGCHIVVVTLGRGIKLGGKATAVCYIRDTENEYITESGRQRIVSERNTTGAGDAFATGFLYGIIKGRETRECGLLGNIVAQLSMAKLGARESLPTFTELAQHYRELYNENL
jgi:sugar/nucleoside kinase (ribokinase family)